MSKEKKINIEDGNAQQQTVNEQAANSENANNNENSEQTAEVNEENTDNESAKSTDNQSDSDTKAENATAQEHADEEKEEEDPLAKAQHEVEDLKKQLLYKTAEFENYRKRTLKEKADLILNGGEKTISAILPVLDDFERALADKSEDPKVIKEGVQMIFNKFVKALESLGVKKIETQDKDFDVDYHEAIAMVPGMGDDKKGKVIDCVQTGYTLNDKVIRHAKVAVGQ